jgi:hypothetical protein
MGIDDDDTTGISAIKEPSKATLALIPFTSTSKIPPLSSALPLTNRVPEFDLPAASLLRSGEVTDIFGGVTSVGIEASSFAVFEDSFPALEIFSVFNPDLPSDTWQCALIITDASNRIKTALFIMFFLLLQSMIK